MEISPRTRKILMICIVIIGILILMADEDERYDYTFEPTGDITSLYIESDNVEVKIVEGEAFCVEGESLKKDTYTFEQKGETLFVKSIKGKFSVYDFDNFDFPPLITITIPSNIEFDKISIKNGSKEVQMVSVLSAKECKIVTGSGTISMDKIQVDSFTIQVGSGDINIKELSANTMETSVGSGDIQFGYTECDKLSMEIGSGDVNCKSLEARNATVEIGSGRLEAKNVKLMNIAGQTGSGKIYLKGELTGTSKFTCGSGKIELNIEGDMEDYSFKIDGEDVSINGKEYSKNYKSEIEMDRQLQLKAGSGRIDVTIR
ncbi:DUF4097 family beta strand repeat-containing protein [Anaerosporobacter sp.]|uniref:DUF4097 family beta strand repeat-containing protein n=1 Tax=Anaerosporobacter sp. TaxID=1872529 RepID=UPI00286EDBA8|nr:DUF4097 family beta strand repeat-containing protein [Anaerosporobacter sp.]